MTAEPVVPAEQSLQGNMLRIVKFQNEMDDLRANAELTVDLMYNDNRSGSPRPVFQLKS